MRQKNGGVIRGREGATVGHLALVQDKKTEGVKGGQERATVGQLALALGRVCLLTQDKRNGGEGRRGRRSLGVGGGAPFPSMDPFPSISISIHFIPIHFHPFPSIHFHPFHSISFSSISISISIPWRAISIHFHPHVTTAMLSHATGTPCLPATYSY